MLSRKKHDLIILRIILILGVLIIPIAFKRKGIKDWLFVYLWNGFTNILLDKWITSIGKIQYPARLCAKVFNINVPFDLVWYPLISVFYNQLTKDDNLVRSFYRLFYFTIPIILIEAWAEKNTKLIAFQKGWKWYHSFISLNVNSLLTKGLLKVVKKIDTVQTEQPS